MKIKNIAILFLVKFLNLFTKVNKIRLNKLKVLILSTTGLGDTLWASPFLMEIKNHYPNSEVCFLTTAFGKELLKNNPHIDSILVFRVKKLIFLLKTLKRQKIQIVFHLHTSQRLVLPLASVIGAEKIVGYRLKTKGLGSLLTDGYLDEKKHQIERRLKLLSVLNINAKISAPKYYFANPNFCKMYHSEIKILIHPGAKDCYKLWPIDYYLELAKMYQEKYKAKLFFSIGPSDHHLKKHLKKNGTLFIVENLLITSYAEVISKMQLFITNDSGPMHLAAAIGVPTIGIFSVTDPNECGPIGQNAKVVYQQKTCMPCLNRKCKEPFCFYQINARQVFEVSKKILNKMSCDKA